MERFELEQALKEEIRTRVFGDGFMKIVQTVRRNGQTFKIAIRPVEIGGARHFQAEMTEGGAVQVKNFDSSAIASGLEEIIAQRGARDLHVMTAKGDLHVRVTKKGHVLVSRSGEMNRAVSVLPHDRVKKSPLTSFESTALLKTIGLMDGEGRLRASMRGKYDQVNEFLKVVGETVGGARREATEAPFTVVDCGCGKAYLTLSLYFYLIYALGFPTVKIIGIDRRADVIEAARRMAAQLDVADKVIFVEADLTTFDWSRFDLSLPARPTIDLVVSLHACDTATDEALARGVEWKSRFILSAPCCQHELHKSIGGAATATDGRGSFAGVLRQSILKERLCDILTDSFRAQLLRVLGYKTQVVEFVSSEATARNILLRCEYGVKPGQGGPVGEYLSLRDFWRVTPWLETRLQSRLQPLLARYEV